MISIESLCVHHSIGFAQNLKGYARLAGIEQIHLHQLRHSFARMVAEESGSITETRGSADASACLDHSCLCAANRGEARQAQPEDQSEIEEGEGKMTAPSTSSPVLEQAKKGLAVAPKTGFARDAESF